MATDIWTPRQVEICTEYAKGNDNIALGMLSNNIDAIGFLETVMKDKLGNSLLRERITSKIEKLDHSCQMHDYDAHNPSLNRPAEVKSEQHCTISGRQYQVTGGGAFGIQNHNSVTRLTNDNPIMYVNAFIDGRLAYNVSFDFADSKIAKRLIDTLNRRKQDNVSTQPKFMWSDWIDAKSLTVTYLNERYFKSLYPHISTELSYAIKRKWRQQEAALALLKSQPVSNIVLPDQCLTA